MDRNLLFAWKAAGRDIDVRITVGDTVYDKETVVSCNISVDGDLFKSNMKMLTLQLTGVEDIGSDYINSVEIGVYYGGKYNYVSWGDFYVDYKDDSTIYDECSDVLTLIAYDGMYKLMQPLSGEIEELTPSLLNGLIPPKHVTRSVNSLYFIFSADVPIIIKTVLDANNINYTLNPNGVYIGTRKDDNNTERNNITLGYNHIDFKTYRDILDRLCEMFGVSAYYIRDSAGPCITLSPIMANNEKNVQTMIPAIENSFTTDYCSSFKRKNSQRVTAVKLKGSNHSVTITHPAVENNGITLVFDNNTVIELVDRLTATSGDININKYYYDRIDEHLNDIYVIAASYQKHIIGYEVNPFEATTYGLPWCSYMPPLLNISNAKSGANNIFCTNVNLKVSQGMTESFSFRGFNNIDSEEECETDTKSSIDALNYSASTSSKDTESSIIMNDNSNYIDAIVNIYQNGSVKMICIEIISKENFTPSDLLIAGNIPIPVQKIYFDCYSDTFNGKFYIDENGQLYLTGNKQLAAGDKITCCFMYI